MMNNNGDYYYWGMHMGGWFFILVINEELSGIATEIRALLQKVNEAL